MPGWWQIVRPALLAVMLAAALQAQGVPLRDGQVTALNGLLRWMQAANVSFHGVRPLISPQTGERGMFCYKHMAAGSVLFEAPFDRLLSVRSISPESRERIAALMAGQPANPLAEATLALLFEAVDPHSRWRDYLASLPTSFPAMPSYWSDADASYLEGPILFLLSNFERAAAAVHALAQRSHILKDVVTAERAHWAYRVVATRAALGTDAHDAPVAVILPGLDMFNHNSQVGGRFELHVPADDEDADLAALDPQVERFFSGADCKAGQEAFYSYGSFTSAEMLSQHGFLEQVASLSVSSLFSRVDLPTSKQPGFPLYASEAQRRAAQQTMLDSGCATREVRLRDGQPLAAEFVQCARLLGLSKKEAAALASHGYFDRDVYRAAVSLDSELDGLGRARRRLAASLALYSTSTAQDEALLNAKASPSLSRNARNAVMLRLAEKRLLTRAIGELDTLIAERKQEAGWVPRSKRKRNDL